MSKHIVRLLFETDADSHDEAVNNIVEQLATHGIRNWVYRVTNLVTEETVHVDGWGDEVDLDARIEDGDMVESADLRKRAVETVSTSLDG